MATQPSSSTPHIDIGKVISRVFETYQQAFATLIPAALIVFVPVALLAAITRDSVGGGLLAAVVSLVASMWYSGMVVRTVQDVQDGKVDASIGELFSSVAPVLGSLILVSIVSGIGIAIGLLLCLVPGLILLTWWVVGVPVVVIENPGVFAALSRSRELVRGNGWQVFGTIIAIVAIMFVISIVFSAISAIGDSFALFFIFQLLISLAVAPFYALAVAVLYFTLREFRGEAALAVNPAGSGPGEPATDAFGNPVQSGGFAPPVAPPAPEPAPPADEPFAPPVPADPPPATQAPGAPEPGGETPPSPPAGPPEERPPGQSIPPPGWQG